MDAKKMFSFLPVIVPVIYILGYLVTSSYLSRYGINDNSVLNFAYLRSGALFFLIILILLWINYLSIYDGTMTNNLSKAWPRIISVYAYSLIFSIIITGIFFDFVQFTKTQLIIIVAIIIIIGLFNLNHYKLDKFFTEIKALTVKVILMFFFITSILVIGSWSNWKIAAFTLMCVVLSQVIALTVGDFGDKNYKSMVLANLIALILSATFFGYYIYGDVPAKFGGGASYQIVVQDANNTVNFRLQDTVSVVYENNDRLLIVDEKENIMFVDKDAIPIYKVIIQK